MAQLIEKLPKVRGIYRQNALLKNWFDVGGVAEVMFRPADIIDLQNFLKTVSALNLQNIHEQIHVQILGAGSNVIIADEGVKGVVIRLPSSFAKISNQGQLVTVGASALCGNVARYCADLGLSGLEFLSGIPGSIGGAIAMNAGCYGSEISHFLLTAEAVDNQGNIHEIKNSDFGFFYRGNNIAKKFIFISATFSANISTSELVAKKINELQEKREATQPIRAKTGGSTFKNPIVTEKMNLKAWELIDKIGYRGKKVGDAQISEKHCNFLINIGNASASDLMTLGEEVRKKVKTEFGVDLEWEIKFFR